MKLILPVFIFSLLSVSCSNSNKIKIPKDVICQDTMVDILTDIHVVKASQQMGIAIDTADTNKEAMFESIWKKHRITQKEYEKSMDFYTHNSGVLDSMYEKVLNNLSKEKAELLAKRHLNKK
jgi:hypothetical protein